MYMMVTNDKYELPLAVADTASELAQIVGTSTGCIYTTISDHKRDPQRHPHSKYVKVDIDIDIE